MRMKQKLFKPPRGMTTLIGIDPQRNDILVRFQRPGVDGSFKWPRGKEMGEILVGDRTAFTIDGGGRAFIFNRKTLETYGAEERALQRLPDDGWTLGQRALGIHEYNVANSGPQDWLTTLLKYTPILCIALIIIVVVGFGALYAT